MERERGVQSDKQLIKMPFIRVVAHNVGRRPATTVFPTPSSRIRCPINTSTAFSAAFPDDRVLLNCQCRRRAAVSALALRSYPLFSTTKNPKLLRIVSHGQRFHLSE